MMSILLRLTMFSVVALGIAAPSFAMSGEGCGGECSACHSLSVKEANAIVGDLGHVTSVKPAAVRGLFALTVEKDGKTALVYMDYGKKHLIGGQILDIASRQVVWAPAAEAKHKDRLDPANLTTKNALVMGNPKGKKRLFVFTDPECPFCSNMHAELKKLVGMEPDLVIYIKMFPLKMHPHAYDKARVILGQKSLKLLEKSYAGEALPAPGARDGKKAVDDTLHFAESVGINAAPTLVLPDGRIVAGFRDAKAVKDMLK